jgi:carbon storage regulator
MLVLSRKPAEAIKIGDDIIVKVIAIRGGQVKLGIEAPQGIRVTRTEPRSGEKQAPPAIAESVVPPAVAGLPEETDNHMTAG